MNVDLTAGIVRIVRADGETAGTGFLVTDDGLIATCAHVVEAAGAGPGDAARVVFHATSEEREAQVEPAWWRGPDAEDVAILRLDGPVPEGVIPLSLGISAGVEGHALSTFGFPAPKPVEGMAGKCEVVGCTTERGFPVLQLRSSEVTPGFSGAPVLDTVTRRVVGMVTAITAPDQYGRLPETAFITPTETLRAVCPELQLSDICPYQGLAAFSEADAEFFFGRDSLVADLVAHLRGNPRFLAVVGPSGSGKSSVVRAGLFPALRRGEVPGSADWHLLTFRPGANPFAALNAAGLTTFQENNLQTCRPADLQTYNLQTAIRAFLETHPQVKRLVPFADQFEEFFTLCPQPVQEQFLRQLAALLEGNLSVTLVLTLRADFYGHLLRYRPLVEWLKIGQVNVPPMGPEELRAAVEEPATGLGLRFEPGLVETIVEEAGEADHPLPLLESALIQLWEKREDGTLTHAAYQAVGQVAGAIGQWAEDAYTELAPQERLLARRVFARLVRYGEGEVADTRQRQSLSEFVTRPEEQQPLHQLVQRLADARLLVTGGDPGAETVEIIHDALLQQWGRLRHWTAEQREFYLWRQRLDERLQEWEEKGQDEGALLRGSLLVEAERWLARYGRDVSQTEQLFIRASREQKMQEEQQWKELYEEAERQRRIAVARQLAAQARLVVNDTDLGLVRSLLLAVESLRRHLTPDGTQVIRQVIGPVGQDEHLPGHHVVVFSPDGQWVASGGAGLLPKVRVWEVSTGKSLAFLEHKMYVLRAIFSPNGKWVATACADGVARVWDVVKGVVLAQMVHGDGVADVAFSPDGQRVVSGSWDNTVRVWEAATGREVAQMEHQGSVHAVTFSSDGRWVASASWDHTARVWEGATGREVAQVEHEEVVNTVALSPDGQQGVSASRDGIVRVWRAATGQEVSRMEHNGKVFAAVFSPDGQRVVSGSWDNTVRVWEAATGHEVARIEHERQVNAVAFSPDGQYVASGGYDNTLRVWRSTTGQEIDWIKHKAPVRTVAFSPKGQWVASTSQDGLVQIWLWRLEDLISEACARVPRNLTPEEWKRYIGDEPYRPTCPNLPVLEE